MNKDYMEIYLRKMTLDDFSTVSPWFNNPDNALWLNSIYRFGKYNPITHNLGLKQKSNCLFLGLSNESPVGFVGLSQIDIIDKSAMVWYTVASEKSRNKGIGTQLVHLILKEAFNSLNLHTVYASVAEPNISSCKVLEKNNFKQVGIQRQCHLINGKFYNRVIFDIVAGEHAV
jgi:diamine N-acetyltransferase